MCCPVDVAAFFFIDTLRDVTDMLFFALAEVADPVRVTAWPVLGVSDELLRSDSEELLLADDEP